MGKETESAAKYVTEILEEVMERASKEATADEMVIFGQISTDHKDILKRGAPFETKLTIRQIPDFNTSDLLRRLKQLSSPESRTFRYSPLEPGLEIPSSVQNEKAVLRTRSKELIKYLSTRYVHEGEHRRLASDEYQYYMESLLNSFYLPLLYATGEMNAKQLPMLAAQQSVPIQNSRVLQEACALKAEQKFLQQHNPVVDLEDTIEQINYRRLLDTYLETGEVTKELQDNAIYAFAQWLMDRVEQRWAFNVEDVAFRFAKHVSSPDEYSPELVVKQPAADSVFMIAAFTDEIPEDETIDKQVSSLKTAVNEYHQNQSWSYTVGFEVETSVEAGYSLQKREVIAASLLQEKASLAVESELDFLVPLVCREYPGKEQIRWPMWRLLNNMYLVTEIIDTGEATEINRTLWIDETLLDQWADQTKLLQMAVKLQELRDDVFLPLVNAHSGRSQLHISKLLALIEGQSLLPETDPWPLIITPRKLTDVHELGEEVLTQWDSDNYQDLIDDLSTLGRAINREDKQQVRKFF